MRIFLPLIVFFTTDGVVVMTAAARVRKVNRTRHTRPPRRHSTPAPTSAPTSAPTLKAIIPNLPPFPPGPYITADASSEIVTIPDPPTPTTLVDSQTNCPHLQSGLLDWHAASTWAGGTIPQAGQNATLPLNAQVLISSSVIGQLEYIIIPNTSSLIIGENPNGITLDARGMDVQGTLQAGSESCRIQTPITITLHNPRPIDAVTNPQPVTYKGIAVMGTLQLHGKRYFRTWTRLAKTVNPGDTVLLLQHSVNWEAGQQVVLVTTAVKDSPEWHQNEVLTILAVNVNPLPTGVGAAVYLNASVQYTHLAITSGYQGEVGLLSRKIVVQGASDDSEPTDLDPLNCTGTRNIYGTYAQPCGNTSLTGFGAHMIMYNGGRGFVEGVELYRVGQTNVLGRYPMHFHVLGECPECYFRYSSIHRSYYRCISVHGTNSSLVSENVGYDITGFCYYLEDGVEENNTISYNLAAHIRNIGPENPFGTGSTTGIYEQSPILTNPADTTASGYYITNVHNNIIGNAASGGWAGFAFPLLPNSVGVFRNVNFRPLSATSLTIDGNTAHSTGWFWFNAGAFYFGGALYYNTTNILQYEPGRNDIKRIICNVNPCAGSCTNCPEADIGSTLLTNSKVFLVPSTGLNSWSGRLQLQNFEAHDVAQMVEVFSDGFWLNNGLCACRSGQALILPPKGSATYIRGNGKFLYDTAQNHILTNVEMRNCGYRSILYDQYDNSTTRGCGDNVTNGCSSDSNVFAFVAGSDQFAPQIMMATKNITFTSCGRRFSLPNPPDKVAGRNQNWLDYDGSVTGLRVPSMIGSGDASAQAWWEVDDQVVYDPQGPLRFIKQTNGPQRGLGHFDILWDSKLQNQVGTTTCTTGVSCPIIGYMRHLGHKFSPSVSGSAPGMPLTATGKFTGPVGGYGWLLTINAGAPITIRFQNIEVLPNTPMLVTIPYPKGTSFNISAKATGCKTQVGVYTCQAQFYAVTSISQVRNGLGNTYYVDSNGVLTLRLIQMPENFVGQPNWFLPSLTDPGRDGLPFAFSQFEENGVLLPRQNTEAYVTVQANCPSSDGVYCSSTPASYDPDVCPSGYVQTAYDECCTTVGSTTCVYADGSSR